MLGMGGGGATRFRYESLFCRNRDREIRNIGGGGGGGGCNPKKPNATANFKFGTGFFRFFFGFFSVFSVFPFWPILTGLTGSC